MGTAFVNSRYEAQASCQELITRFENNFEDFKQRIVTGDETWLHCWDPDTKQESMQWKHVGSPPPRKARTQALAGKVMATIFWDTQGVILIDYLPQGSTITALTTRMCFTSYVTL